MGVYGKTYQLRDSIIQVLAPLFEFYLKFLTTNAFKFYNLLTDPWEFWFFLSFGSHFDFENRKIHENHIFVSITSQNRYNMTCFDDILVKKDQSYNVTNVQDAQGHFKVKVQGQIFNFQQKWANFQTFWLLQTLFPAIY